MKNIAKGVIAVGALLASSTSLAITASSTINPTVTITSSCTIDTSGVVTAFGSLEQGSGSTTFPGDVSITCTNGMNYGLGVGPGQTYVGYPQMSDGSGNIVRYVFLSGGVPVGDRGLDTVDPTYTPATLQDYLPLTGTGTAQVVEFNVLVTVDTQPTGTYSDTNSIVVVWP